MLAPKTKNKKNSAQSADSTFRKGVLLLQDKLYKQAMIELKIALERNPLAIKPELESLFDKYDESGSREIALTIGLVLFQVKREEPLAIKLGNYSRRTGNYKQANNLYRQALKINRTSKLAFYNLAASMGHVEKYDDEILKLIKQYFKSKNYVLPDYLDGNSTINRAKKYLLEKNLKEKTESLENLSTELENIRSEGDPQKLEQLQKKLEKAVQLDEEASYQQIIEYTKSEIAKQIDQKNEELLAIDLFNLGVFALHYKDVATALEYLLIAKSNELDLEDLDLALGLASAINGHVEEALRILTDKIRFDRENRLLNINLALLHRRVGNKLLSYKYQIISSALLEKSHGLIFREEIFKKADSYFKQGLFDKAVKLYQIVADESNDVKAWMTIGEIHLKQKRQLEALDSFKRLQKLFPDSSVVAEKIIDVHNQIAKQGDDLFNSSKFSQASVLYERALKLVRTPATIQKLISTYKRLNKFIQIDALSKEFEELTNVKKAEDKLEQKQEMVVQGRIHLKKQEFDAAIACFEKAFNIEPDKDVFAYLAYIFKGLNRKRMLEKLLARWHEHESRLKKTSRFLDNSNPN